MSQVAPFEIMAAPFTCWLAPVGTAFPDLSVAPAVAWVQVGTSGDKNYDDEGVTVAHEQTIEEFVPVGLTAARKAFRTEESVVVSFNLVDVSAAQYAKILNAQTVTDTAAGVSIAGNLNFPLLQGGSVATFALLLRGTESAAATAPTDNFKTQYELPMVYQNSSPEVQYRKGEPAMLALEFRALWDATNGFGRFRSQDAAAS